MTILRNVKDKTFLPPKVVPSLEDDLLILKFKSRGSIVDAILIEDQEHITKRAKDPVKSCVPT
jgi:hypothetical protein